MMLGQSIDCANPLNRASPFNYGLLSDFTYIPGLANQNRHPSGSTGHIIHDLTEATAFNGRVGTTFNYSSHGCSNGVTWSQFTPTLKGLRPGSFGGQLSSPGSGTGMRVGGANLASRKWGGCTSTTRFSGYAWCRIASSNAGPIMVNAWGSGPGWQFGVTNISRLLHFKLLNSGGGAGRNVEFGSFLALSTWFHLAFTYDGSNLAAGIRGFINGEYQTTISVVSDVDPGAYTTQEPALCSGLGILNGDLDNVRLFNRTLTDYEVQQHYQESAQGSQNTYNFISIPDQRFSVEPIPPIAESMRPDIYARPTKQVAVGQM